MKGEHYINEANVDWSQKEAGNREDYNDWKDISLETCREK